MKKKTGTWLAALSIIFMGFGFPALLAYLAAAYSLNIWFVGIFTFLSLLGVVVVVGSVSVFWHGFGFSDDEYYERLRDVTDALGSLLQRMDNIYNDLVEIDEILKMEE